MAAKKKSVTKKKMAVKKKGTGTAMVSMSDLKKKMAEEAVEESKRLDGGESSFISIKGGSFTYQGADLGDTLEVVILDFVSENSYYTSYDPDNPSSPGCYAIGREKNKYLTPLPDCAKLQDKEGCEDCWANEWESADTGKGKACKNTKRISVISTSDLEDVDTAENADVAFIRVPPTSVKSFEKFAKGVTKIHKEMIYGMVVEISFDDDSDYEALLFKAVRPIDDVGILTTIIEKKEQYKEELEEPTDISNYNEPKKKKGKSSSNKSSSKKKGRSKMSRK